MRLLVTGAGGQVGRELARSLQVLGEVVALQRADCDLARPATLAPLVARVCPDVIVNAAAHTAVDRAEGEPELAHTINAEAVGALAAAARAQGALLLHYSTDYVFDGAKAGAYTETDATNPLGVYGRTKLAGEAALRDSGADYLTLRTTWVYAARGKNFLRTILRLAQEREELKIVADQHGAPTWARNLADVTAHIVRQAQAERRAGVFAPGLFHCSAAGTTSWHGFAEEIVRLARLRLPEGAIRCQRILPIATEAYPTPAQRPKNSMLSNEKLYARFGLRLPQWQLALATCFDELADLPG